MLESWLHIILGFIGCFCANSRGLFLFRFLVIFFFCLFGPDSVRVENEPWAALGATIHPVLHVDPLPCLFHA